MQRFMRLKRDPLLAWLVAALLGYLLALQGAVAAYAKGTMAAHDLTYEFVLCLPSSEDGSGHDHPLAGLDRDCCTSACQMACGTGPLCTPETHPRISAPHLVSLGRTAAVEPLPLPARAVKAGHARAPPTLSI